MLSLNSLIVLLIHMAAHQLVQAPTMLKTTAAHQLVQAPTMLKTAALHKATHQTQAYRRSSLSTQVSK